MNWIIVSTAGASDWTSFSAWERWRYHSFSKLTIALPLVNFGVNWQDCVREAWELAGVTYILD